MVPSDASSTLASPTTNLILVPFLALILTPSLSNWRLVSGSACLRATTAFFLSVFSVKTSFAPEAMTNDLSPTLSPLTGSGVGGANFLLQMPPRMTGLRGSPPINATRTSSPTSGMRCSPRDLPAPGETTRAQAESSLSEMVGSFTLMRPTLSGSFTFVTVPIANWRRLRTEPR